MRATALLRRGPAWGTITLQDGPQDNPFTLPRLRISGETAQDSFQAMVAAYLP